MLTILSGIFGGLIRLAPELFKFLDAKNERKHELDLQDKAIEFQKLKGNQQIDEITTQGRVEVDNKSMDAYLEALKEQATPSGIHWVDAFSKLIRPLITLQWVVLMYPGVIIATFVISIVNGVAVIDALNHVFGAEEKALVSFLVDFWFVGRAFKK